MTNARTIELPAGPIEYTEMGTGRPIVFVHGIFAGPELWMPLAELLAPSFRCILPCWPLGTHQRPLNRDADLRPSAVARLVADFARALELDDVILVGNDSGGAVCQLVCADHGERIGALVLTNCDALEVFPPRLFSYIRWLTYVPGGYTVLAHTVRWLPFVRRMPMAWGSATNEPQREIVAGWCRRLTRRSTRRDAWKFARGAKPAVTLEVAERLHNFERPALLLWGEDDRFFKPALAERLANKFPDARVELVPSAKTFVSLDQPQACAERIRAFAKGARDRAA